MEEVPYSSGQQEKESRIIPVLFSVLLVLLFGSVILNTYFFWNHYNTEEMPGPPEVAEKSIVKTTEGDETDLAATETIDEECVGEEERIAGSKQYKKVRDTICFNGKVVRGATAGFFVALDAQYTAPSSELIGRKHYKYDSYDAFDESGYYENGVKTYSAEDDTFEVLEDKESFFIRIENEIYAQQPTGLSSFILDYVTTADSFEIIGHGYARNDRSVFHKSSHLKHMPDPDRFYVETKEYDYGGEKDEMVFGVYQDDGRDYLFHEATLLHGLSIDDMQIINGGQVLHNDMTAWGLDGGCHFPSYREIDYETKDEHYSC